MRHWWTVGLVGCLSTAAVAQQEVTYSTMLDRFTLNASGNGSLLLSNGQLVPRGQLNVSLLSSYAQNLKLSRELSSGTTPTMDRLYGHVSASFGLTDWAEASFQAPIVLSQSLHSGASSLPSSPLWAPVLALRAGFNESEYMPISLSLELAATVPYGDSGSGSNSASVYSRPMPALRLNLGKDLGFMRVFGELNAIEQVDHSLRISPTEVHRVGDWLGYGVGCSVPVPGLRELSFEAAGAIEHDVDFGGSFAQGLVGARYQAGEDIAIAAMGGPAVGSLLGVPDWRFMGGIIFTPSLVPGDKGDLNLAKKEDTGVQVAPKDKCAEKGANPADCPYSDVDEDGIANRIDQCPTEAGIARLDGCALRDKDMDGLADADDACPEEQGPVARRGCPVKDRDEDGIVDASDACPDEQGIVELKGCAAKDKDGDEIADHLDNCPEEKGVANNSGCPTKNKQLVKITKSGLEIKDRIYFGNNNAKIQRRSNRMLKQVATVLKSHPNIEKLLIAGHTDDRGSADRNRELSQERAEAVRSFLIQEGMDPGRLDAKGFGPDKPIDTNRSAAGRANNRRVEFLVVDPGTAISSS